MTADEARRQERLVDQMTTMHSRLRDRAEFRGQILGLSLIVSSFLVLLISVASDEFLLSFGWAAAEARRIGAVVSVGLFVLSLVELRLSYGIRAAGHGEAARRLSTLKQHYRVELARPASPARLAALADEYRIVCSSLPPIPENQFHSLKVAHLRKIQLSRLIDLHPHVPLALLRLRLAWDGIRGRTSSY